MKFLAFSCIYVVWGSTYLAIRYALETVPPFTMIGTRSVAGGLILLALAMYRGAARPTRAQWGSALLVGALLFLGGHGALSWGETRVASGPAALITATLALWMVVLGGIGRRGTRPTPRAAAGIVLGLAAVALLVLPPDLAGAGQVDRMGALVILGGSFSWAAGAVVSQRLERPDSVVLATAMQLLCGGALLLLLGVATGESFSAAFSSASTRSLAALAYLVVFGTVIAFTAYTWLLRVATPAQVGTHAYVNPAVAILLGAAVGDGVLSVRQLLAAGLMLPAVAILLRERRRGRSAPKARAPARREIPAVIPIPGSPAGGGPRRAGAGSHQE